LLAIKLSSQEIASLAVQSSGLLVGAAPDSSVFASTDGGKTWLLRSKQKANAVVAGGGQEMWGLHGRYGIHEPDEASVFHSADDGAHWRSYSTQDGPGPTPRKLAHIPVGWVKGEGVSPQFLSARPTELVEPAGGSPSSWKRIAVPCEQPVLASRSGGRVVVGCEAVAGDAQLARSEDSGRTWQKHTLKTGIRAASCSARGCTLVDQDLTVWSVAARIDARMAPKLSLKQLFERAESLGCDQWRGVIAQLERLGLHAPSAARLAQLFRVRSLEVLGDGYALAGDIELSAGAVAPLTTLVVNEQVSWTFSGENGTLLDPSGRLWLLGPGVNLVRLP
jgi:hypothetical protein